MHDESESPDPAPLVARTFEPTTTDPVEAVFLAVAETGQVDLTTAEPLARVVDPDALDAIFGRDAQHEGVEVRFQYEGLEIRLTGDGDVSVTEQAVEGQATGPACGGRGCGPHSAQD